MQVGGGRGGAEAWRAVAPDLLIVHRPLPQFAEGVAATSPDAKRMAGCTRAALKPLEVRAPSHGAARALNPRPRFAPPAAAVRRCACA